MFPHRDTLELLCVYEHADPLFLISSHMSLAEELLRILQGLAQGSSPP